MKKTVDLGLVKRAQQGHQESLSTLAEVAREDVFAYLHRVTLDVHLAEDLSQETIVQMLESLPELQVSAVKAFWAWMYKTAFSRVSRQFRNQGKNRLQKHTATDSELLSRVPDRGLSGPAALMQKELAAAVYEAMDSVKLRYRNILTLRCLQDFSYAQIASTTGGTELQARLLFFRAKRSLRHQLAARGYKKKTQLLPALSLFAALTAGRAKTTSAATLVKAATLDVSAGTVVLGMATTKVGLAAMVTVAACIIGGAAGLNGLASSRDEPRPVAERVKNLDKTLLDLLRSPDFMQPSAIGKLSVTGGKGFLWTDRSYKAPAATGADLGALLLNKPRPDLQALILTTEQRLDVWFENSILDGPGADIVVAGWADPPAKVEVLDAEGRGVLLLNPGQLKDTWDRTIWGYDLAQLPKPFAVRAVRLTGVHSQGPHQGFELNEIRARVVQKVAQLHP